MWFRWLPLVCAVFAGHAASSAQHNEYVAKWKAIEANAKSLVQKVISMSYRDALPLIHDAELSSGCFVSLTSVLRGLQELNTDVVRRAAPQSPVHPGNFQEDGGHPQDGATSFGEKGIAQAWSQGTGKSREDKAEQRATGHDKRRP
ncbi:hypothetical protein HPB50_012855 [Hyalomma asiaticum]|uniref:Uncharacterized protein n=1 Tax=Hyalomma asiaticum TaxID=266040 RepID=A0ACB7TJQ3_HYAAI|nr:hypothetical protein HPB50_012855 [Hyalomma asiaticum]